MGIALLESDKKFYDSPDTGWPECICSRCGNMIKELEMPLHLWPDGENSEYRFCEACQEKYFGIKYDHHDDDDF